VTHSSIRLWFALAVSVFAAAIADPIVERASNAGVFGRGVFTDHSNLDVVPAALVGLLFVVLLLAFKARAILLRNSSRALDDACVLRILPFAFAGQIVFLYIMETTEQLVVYGHTLGGAVWLGGPIACSLAMHAATCAIVALVLAKSLRSLADAAVRIVRLVRALAARPVQPARPILGRDIDRLSLNPFGPVLCRIGERAPPLF
jgi:hypothetical protein